MIFHWKKDKKEGETPTPADDEQDKSWFSRLSDGLSKSSGKITQGLSDFVTKRKLDQDALDELEEVLIAADLGPKTAAKIITEFSKDRFEKDISNADIRAALSKSMNDILMPVAKPLEIVKPEDGSPFVILVCGVNGAGKTTTIGKLAKNWKETGGHKVMIAAADTFRAAAVEQLHVWAQRAGAAFYAKDEGADPASVAFEAYAKAKEDSVDILVIDTAGRLQNKTELMAELTKITRVLKKQNDALPHACVLVLDAGTGQNAHSQVELFSNAVDVSGLIVTKLDGSAKGGVVISLADRFALPIHAIGVGEAAEDLQSFNPEEFTKILMG